MSSMAAFQPLHASRQLLLASSTSSQLFLAPPVVLHHLQHRRASRQSQAAEVPQVALALTLCKLVLVLTPVLMGMPKLVLHSRDGQIAVPLVQSLAAHRAAWMLWLRDLALLL